MESIKLLIVDDHPVFREGLCQMLDEIDDIECIGQASDGHEAVKLAEELHPDVVILDISMPDLNGIEAARRIKTACPQTSILMLSAFDYESYILGSLQAGASGYLLKDRPLGEIADAIRLVNKGQSVLDTNVTGKIIDHLAFSPDGSKSRPGELNSREMEILKLVAQGMSNKEIASILIISERTVQTHLVNIFKKLKVSSRTQAIIYGLRKGWFNISPENVDVPDSDSSDTSKSPGPIDEEQSKRRTTDFCCT